MQGQLFNTHYNMGKKFLCSDSRHIQG